MNARNDLTSIDHVEKLFHRYIYNGGVPCTRHHH